MPETRYATTVDGVAIAYQVLGEGSTDVVFVSSAFWSNMEIACEFGPWRLLVDALAVRGRLVMFDRRGTGLSDGVSGDRLPTLEARMEDIRTVMDAAGFSRAVLFGLEDGAAHCFLFAATYPERTQALITQGAASRGLWAPDAPWLWTHEQWEEELRAIEAGWGSFEFARAMAEMVFPDEAEDPSFVRSYGRIMRHSLRRADAIAAERMYRDTDVRHVLPTVQAPTLIMHFTDDQVESVEEGRYIAQAIPGAELVELPGGSHGPVLGSFEHLDRFLARLKAEESEFDRVLATVLFTDLVGSTERAATLGDAAWKQLVERHHAAVRALLGRYRGTEIDTAGDGFFATFDGPARAVRYAQSIRAAMQPLGLDIRAGLHTGEVESVNGKIGGIAVSIGARVANKANASEVLVTNTVKDLVAGSGLAFEDAGEHDLIGIPDRWHLYRVAG
jgi:pimeloyl-ACP methyl ester carboxylesterase